MNENRLPRLCYEKLRVYMNPAVNLFSNSWINDLKSLYIELDEEILWISQNPDLIEKTKQRILKKLSIKLKNEDRQLIINSFYTNI